MMHDSNCWEWGMGWGMWFFPLLIILAIYFFSKNNWRIRNEQSPETPLDVLKKRYAKGEISKEEFQEKKSHIEN